MVFAYENSLIFHTPLSLIVFSLIFVLWKKAEAVVLQPESTFSSVQSCPHLPQLQCQICFWAPHSLSKVASLHSFGRSWHSAMLYHNFLVPNLVAFSTQSLVAVPTHWIHQLAIYLNPWWNEGICSFSPYSSPSRTCSAVTVYTAPNSYCSRDLSRSLPANVATSTLRSCPRHHILNAQFQTNCFQPCLNFFAGICAKCQLATKDRNPF